MNEVVKGDEEEGLLSTYEEIRTALNMENLVSMV